MTSSVLSKNMQSDVAQLPLSDRLWDWLETYKRQLALGTGIVVVVGIVVWFIVWQNESKQLAAGAALSQVAANQLDNTGLRTASADDYMKVAREYPKSLSGARALLLAAGSLFTEGKYADLAVLSDDYLTVPDTRIRKIDSVLTLLGGKIVHATAPFSQLLKP